MLKKILFFSLAFFFFLPQVTGQNFTASFVKSVQLRTENNENSNPVFMLGEPLFVSFDDLEADQKNYSYHIAHCNYNWEVSGTNPTLYIDGYDSFDIQDFKTSFNTLQNFTHHYFQIPNQNTRIKISGNYLLTILNEEEEICVQRRFVIYEPKVNISAKSIRDRNLKNIDSKQVVQFSILHPNLIFNKPAQELKICVLQNNDWNFIKKDLRPQFYKKNEIAYQYNEETSFYGRNEFLNFDSKNITGTNVNIAGIGIRENGYHTYLYPTIPRAAIPYTYFPDINGAFVVRTLNGVDAATESDYTWVHFSLDTQSKNPKEKIYVYGAFNNYAMEEENMLRLNEDSQMLETTLQLKQGFYNYTFATLEKNHASTRLVEGSFFETENDYTVLVYYKPFGARISEIIGVAKINSRQ
jgi:hypothetical protein